MRNEQVAIARHPAFGGDHAIETLWVRASEVSIQASVGIYRGERDARQEIVLNIAAEVEEPCRDGIGETVDYRSLVEEARRLSAEGHFELIETFACELGRRIASLPKVRTVDLELFKPAAIPPAMASVRFRIERPEMGNQHS
jgi:dihydroneopterin aldolase